MAGDRKRPYHDRPSSRSPSASFTKKHHLHSPDSKSPVYRPPHHRHSPASKSPAYRQPPQHHTHNESSRPDVCNRKSFSSYLDTPNLRPKIKLLCEIIEGTPSVAAEKVLYDSGVHVNQVDVEEVLKLSYNFPGSAVKFFRWSGRQLKDDHSPYAWNLVVDMLGKNSLFDAMWDAVKSMRRKGLLSLATFASIFSSYVNAGRVQEAIKTFEVMDQYGVPRDVVALNSLISAICRDGKTVDAVEFLQIVKGRIRPDLDTYAILLEGWENERNVASARQTFAEMVTEVGWDPANVPAYTSFLCTLMKRPSGMPEVIKYFKMMSDHWCYPGMKFFRSALEECTRTTDFRGADLLWEAMVGRVGLRPDTEMYNSMIALRCYANHTDLAQRLLDEMVLNGVFPDDRTYNVLFQFLIKSRKLQEAAAVFTEMIKNECKPSLTNCNAAARMHIDTKDAYMALKIWKWMVENYNSDLDETGNKLIIGLVELDWLPEAVKYAEDIIERGIKLYSSTLSRLKQSLSKVRKSHVHDDLLKKWKGHSEREA